MISLKKIPFQKSDLRMQLGLSHLAEHKFRHNFEDCLNPVYSCCHEIATTSPFPSSLSQLRLDKTIYFFEKLTSLILIFYSKTTYL